MKTFTVDQQKAIDTTGVDLLVAAAAGSGKTAVLVERIVKIVTDPDEPVDIDRLLVVTFTKAAAAEMRHRISEAILKKIEEEPSEYLKRQLVLLNVASITTIHSFCQNVVKQNFYALGLDPSFRVADETEIKILRKDILENLFLQEYEEENNSSFIELVEIYGNKYSDDTLQDLVLQLYNFCISTPNPKEWLEEHTNVFNILNSQDFEESIWIKQTKDYMFKVLTGVIQSAEEAIMFCELIGGPIHYVSTLESDIELTRFLIKNLDGSFDDMLEVFNNVKFSAFSRAKNQDLDEDLIKMVKGIRDKDIKKVIGVLKEEVFFKKSKDMVEDLKKLYPIIRALKDLTLKFFDEFSLKKRERNIVDFNDLEHFCIEVIKDEKALQTLQNTYVEVLIDEYQDSNLTQELILSSIAKKSGVNRFLVGDIKQSIYKFRGAEPKLFSEKYEEFSKGDTDSNLKIDLSKNFRSRDTVLNGINFLFRQIMSKEVGEIDYNENASLYYGANFPDGEGFNISENIELNISSVKNKDLEDEDSEVENVDSDDQEEAEDLDAITLESRVIAKRIQKLVSGEDRLYVNDSGIYRPAEFKDIVILTRTVSAVSGVLVEELKKHNIPAYDESATGYFESTEVMVMLSLLRIIDNPQQDIYLIAVLRSPMYGLTSDDLLNIRSQLSEGTFFDCVERALAIAPEHKLKFFMSDLIKWRKVSRYTSTGNLINMLLEETKYFDYVGAMPDGATRQGNLHILEKYAEQYEATGNKGLFHFIRYIDKLMKGNVDIAGAKIISESENVVRIMSIHKSKGLEFPIVFVSMLGRKFNKADEKGNLVLHKDYGFGPQYIDLDKRTRSTTIASFSIKNKINEEGYSEGLRVLYVALTRAKEKLILTGCVDDFEKKLKKWSRFVFHKNEKIPPGYLLKAENLLDFIVPCVLRHKDSVEFSGQYNSGNRKLFKDDSKWVMQVNYKEDIIASKFDIHEHKLELKEKLDAMAENLDTSSITEKFNFKYPLAHLINLPTTLTIFDINQNFHSHLQQNLDNNDAIAETRIFRKPEFMRENKKLTADKVGTAIHKVMENLDLKIHEDKNSVIALLDSLILKGILTKEEKDSIPIYNILAFLESPLASRMRNSTYLKREIPFTMMISGKEAYLDSDDKVIVSGIIDCYFVEGDNIVLVDYKSNFITNNKFQISEADIQGIKEKYRIQLSIYKKALENVSGKKVSQCIIYLVAFNQEIVF